VLGHSERVQNGSRPILGHGFRDLLDLRRRDACDLFAHLECVSGNEFLKLGKDTVWIVQALCDAWVTAAIKLVSPGLCVVLVLLLVKAAEQSIFEVETT
jgi:hypothetical protein